MRRLPLTVICDFDDTAAAQNVAHLLLDKFAGGRDHKHLEGLRAGRLSFREYQERAFLETRVPVPEMAAYVRANASLRPGFSESVQAARAAGVVFAIVSAGLDFYIRALLDREGHHALPVTAVKATQVKSPGQRIRYDYPQGQEQCRGDWAVCKCRAVEAAKAEGGRVIFAGDGVRSDACAAAKADVIFARARLLEHCKAENIAAEPFDGDLFPLAEYLDRQRTAK